MPRTRAMWSGYVYTCVHYEESYMVNLYMGLLACMPLIRV